MKLIIRLTIFICLPYLVPASMCIAQKSISLQNKNIPTALLTTISVNLHNINFEKALAVISEKGNFKLNYNRSRIPVSKKISVSMSKVHALEALLNILEKTNTELHISAEAQNSE